MEIRTTYGGPRFRASGILIEGNADEFERLWAAIDAVTDRGHEVWTLAAHLAEMPQRSRTPAHRGKDTNGESLSG